MVKNTLKYFNLIKHFSDKNKNCRRSIFNLNGFFRQTHKHMKRRKKRFQPSNRASTCSTSSAHSNTPSTGKSLFSCGAYMGNIDSAPSKLKFPSALIRSHWKGTVCMWYPRVSLENAEKFVRDFPRATFRLEIVTKNRWSRNFSFTFPHTPQKQALIQFDFALESG